jgi:hypothetical protein
MHKRPRDGHALLLAAGELAGLLARLLGYAHAREIGHGPLLRLGARQAAHPHRAEGEVLQHRQVREQVELLEHHAHLAPRRIGGRVVEHRALDADRPSVVALQPVDAADQGGLAGARGPADHHLLAARHIHRHAPERVKAAEALFHAVERDHRCGIHGGLPATGTGVARDFVPNVKSIHRGPA